MIDLEAYQFDHTAVKNSQHQKNKFSKQNHSKFEKIVREEYSFTLNQRINVKSATKAEISKVPKKVNCKQKSQNVFPKCNCQTGSSGRGS